MEKVFWAGVIVGMVTHWAATKCPYVLRIVCIDGRWNCWVERR